MIIVYADFVAFKKWQKLKKNFLVLFFIVRFGEKKDFLKGTHLVPV